jgi:hypothetical protein
MECLVAACLQSGGGLFAEDALTLTNTSVTCNRAGDVGGGFSVNAFSSEVDDASSEGILNNVAPKCPGYATGRGAVCENNGTQARPMTRMSR